jgi:hypothetical protein
VLWGCLDNCATTCGAALQPTGEAGVLEVLQQHGTSALELASQYLPGSLLCCFASNECRIAAAPINGVSHNFGSKCGTAFGWLPAQHHVTTNTGLTNVLLADSSAILHPHGSGISAESSHAQVPSQCLPPSATQLLPKDAQPDALHLIPRVFLVCEAGRVAEFLQPGVYEHYVEAHHGRQGVTELRHTDASGRIQVHRVVQLLQAASPTPPPLPVAESASCATPEAVRAFSSLHVPCRVYPAPSAGLALPRLATCSTDNVASMVLPPVLLMREFLVQKVVSQELHDKCATVVANAAAKHTKMAAVEEAADKYQQVRCESCSSS